MKKKFGNKRKVAKPPARPRVSRPPQKVASPRFPHTAASPSFPPFQEKVLTDLPFSYGETKLVLLVRDPYWAFSYWDFSGETWNWAQKKLSEDSSLKPMMRIHDLDLRRFHNLLLSLEAKNWYLHLGIPDHRYVAELGMGDGNSRFYLIARSNEVRTPRDSASDVVDPEWNDRDFEEIYRLSGGGHAGLSSFSSFLLSR